MCDNNVCDNYLKTKILQDEDDVFDEFIANLQHEKCKVIQLVRRQIHKFEDMQILSDANNMHEEMTCCYKMEGQSFNEEINQTGKLPLSLFRKVSQSLMSSQTWIEYIYSRLYSRFILATLFLAALLLLLICGGFLKAFLCGNNRFYLTLFRLFHTKRTVF